MTRHIQVTELDFDDQVLGAPGAVLVDFTATWCGPCRALVPVLDQLATRHGDRLKIVTVDGDESPALAARFGVRGFPTLIAFVDGQERGRQLGLARADKLLALFGELFVTSSAGDAPPAS